VRQRLGAVIDPELGDTIVELGMVRAITVDGGRVVVDVALTIAACPLRSQIERDVRGQVEALEWVDVDGDPHRHHGRRRTRRRHGAGPVEVTRGRPETAIAATTGCWRSPRARAGSANHPSR